jgi:hypothetical protein
MVTMAEQSDNDYSETEAQARFEAALKSAMTRRASR